MGCKPTVISTLKVEGNPHTLGRTPSSRDSRCRKPVVLRKSDAQGSLGPTYEDRFQVAVLFSGVGYGMKEFADNAFDGMRKPFIASGGSNDVGRVNPGGMEGREWRKQPYLLSPDIDKYAVITEGSDHYLGGLICNAERGGEPDYEALAIVRTTSVIFLDAYLKDDAKAMQYLATADIASLTQGQASYQYSRSEKFGR